MEALCNYHWPGNVRELQNYVECAVVLAPGDELTCDLLPQTVRGGQRRRIGHFRTADPETLASELVLGEAGDASLFRHLTQLGGNSVEIGLERS